MNRKDDLDFVKSITLKLAFHDIWSWRKKIGAAMVALAVIGGIIGYTQSKLLPQTDDGKDVAKYEAALKSYDIAAEKIKKNLKVSEEQLRKEQEYVNKSPYMRINPQQQWWGELSYKVEAPNHVGDVIQAYNNFVNRGWMSKDLANVYKDEPAAYIQEGVRSGSNGNLWTITILRKDEETIKKLLPLIKECVDKYHQSVPYEHTLTLYKEISYVRADQETQKNQNWHRDTLRRFSNDVASYNKQITENAKQRRNYVRMYKPSKANLKNPLQAAGVYAGFGAILGLLLPVAIAMLRAIMGTKIKSTEELLDLDIPVISEATKDGYKPGLERTVVELVLLAHKQGVTQLYLECLTNKIEISVQVFKEALAKEGVELLSGANVENDANELKSFVKAGKSLALLKLGETNFKDIKDYLHLCQKFDVEVWGLIIVE